MESVRGLIGSLQEWIWRDRPDDSRPMRFARRLMRILQMTFQVTLGNVLMLRASSLAYYTILGIVPLLAIAFSVLKGFGVHSRLDELLVKYLAVGKPEIASHIISYISNTNFKAVGSLGFIMLLYIVINMMSLVEKTLNDLWGGTIPRSWVRKISDYLSVLFISPILVVTSLTMIATFSSNAVVLRLMEYGLFKHFWVLFNSIIPLVGIWVAFTALYVIMPNTRVKVVPALVAGIVAGSVWEGAFRIYTYLNIGVASHNKIYGTLAAFPVLLVWIYISWLVLLVGARFSWAIQHVRTLSPEVGEKGICPGVREHLAVHVMGQICEAFFFGRFPYTAEDLSKALGASMPYVMDVLAVLKRAGLVIETAGEVPAYQPGRDVHGMTFQDIHGAFQADGEGDWRPPSLVQSKATDAAWQDWLRTRDRLMGDVRILPLVESDMKSGGDAAG